MTEFKVRKTPLTSLVYISMVGYNTVRGVFHCREICVLNSGEVFHAIVRMPYHHRRTSEEIFLRGLHWSPEKIRAEKIIQLIYPKLRGKKVVFENSDHLSWFKRKTKKLDAVDCQVIGCWYDYKNAKNHFIDCGRHYIIWYAPRDINECAKRQAFYMEQIIQERHTSDLRVFDDDMEE